MSNKIMKTSENTVQYQDAVNLHRTIMANGELAASALVEFCKGLKQMRDAKLYTELGFDSFENYVEEAVGLRQRQAYNYIKALENLGTDVLQSNARLGITKLELISGVPLVDREEFIENNDLENMSAKEVKELVDQVAKKGEQITLLEAEKEEFEKEADEKEEKIKNLQAELEELQSRPIEVAVQEPDPKTIKKLVQEETKKIKDAQKKKIEDAVKKANDENAKKIESARKEAKKQAAADIKKQLEAVEKEKAAALEKAKELEGKLKIADNKDTVLFAHVFEEFQVNFNKLLGLIKKIETASDTETAKKLRAAVKQTVDAFHGKV